MLQALWFSIFLQQMEVGRRERERLFDAFLPFLARAIAAQHDAARAPRGFVKAADLDDQVALLLRGCGQSRASR